MVSTPVNTVLPLDTYPGTSPLKERLHREWRRELRTLATEVLGLSPTDFDLRSNKAGPAVWGEVTLHTDRVYVQTVAWNGEMQLLYRTCRDRRDYHGGANNYVPARTWLERRPGFIETVKNMQQREAA